MDYYKGFTKQDLIDIQEMDTNEFNKFIYEHHYAKCSACGKEYPYFTSPRLQNNKWEQVKNFYKLTEYTEIKVVKAYNKGSDSAKLSRVNSILKTYPDSCLICPECMEKALGHPLTMDDLVNIPISKDYIKRHNL